MFGQPGKRCGPVGQSGHWRSLATRRFPTPSSPNARRFLCVQPIELLVVHGNLPSRDIAAQFHAVNELRLRQSEQELPWGEMSLGRRARKKLTPAQKLNGILPS